MATNDDDKPSYETITRLARDLARLHLAEARVEGVSTGQGVVVELLVDREAARILRSIAEDIDSEWPRRRRPFGKAEQ